MTVIKSSLLAGESCRNWNIPLMSDLIFQLVDYAPVLKAPWTTCKLHLPVPISLDKSLSSLDFLSTFKNFKLTEGPSIDTWIIFEKLNPSKPSGKSFNKSKWVPWPKNIQFQNLTWTLSWVKFQNLITKSISHCWVTWFKLSSKLTTNRWYKRISSLRIVLKYCAMPWFTK